MTLLDEVLRVAIDEVGQALAERCTALLREDGTSGAIRAELSRLDGLLQLLEVTERPT